MQAVIRVTCWPSWAGAGCWGKPLRRLLVRETRHGRCTNRRRTKATSIGLAERLTFGLRPTTRAARWHGRICLSEALRLGSCPIAIGEVVRFHPRCPWEGERRTCLVGLWREAVTNAARAIHRRPITPAGEKADVWKALGPTASCVIRLWPDELVSNSLVIGEGIETTLAAATRIEHRGTLLRPAWAAGDAGHLKAFPVLPGIEAVTILVDNDESGCGQRAAAECARRWTAAGREVIQLTPRVVGSDFNDLVEVPS